MAAIGISNLHLWQWHSARMQVCVFNFREAVANAVLMEDVAVLREMSAAIPDGHDLGGENTAAVYALKMMEDMPCFVMETADTCVFAHTQWPEIFTAEVIARIATYCASLALASHPLFEDATFAFNVGATIINAVWSEDHAFLEWLLRHRRVSLHPTSEDTQKLVELLRHLRHEVHTTVDAVVAVILRCHPSLAPLLE
eukprot:TRINITY_DN15141_c0_g1_i3.p1 TRINITY_DN15141_c0_g1~~TRINITY_DN15141_c0_g1_i3.p1  ORF type:complete len:198 (-),score=30.70 TRINITY_DN15141_c0_g1_i3:46-639(-)